MEPPSKLMKTNSYLNFTLYYSSIVFFQSVIKEIIQRVFNKSQNRLSKKKKKQLKRVKRSNEHAL